MKDFLKLFLIFTASVMLASCEKYTSDSEEGQGSKEAASTLTIRTRAAAAVPEDGTEISYPVNIYIFNSKNTCVALTTIETEDKHMSLKLPEGNYGVYAIAGADAATYNLPEKEEATKETVISLKEGMQHADLMTATSNINLAFGEENTLTLTLSRQVMMIEKVTINNVPNSVTAVSVTITPLYEGIMLNGGYSGDNGSHTISLTKKGEAGTWENLSTAYLLEASGPATIKVSLSTNNITKSYSYSCTDELKANYKIRITGTYTDKNGITLNGTMTGVAWEGTKDIIFDFDENGSTSTENKPGDVTGGEETGNAPSAGSLYKGCYVLKSVTSGSTTTVTLISAGSKNALTFIRGNQSSMLDAVNSGIAELATEGITGWRLPSLEEMAYVRENLETINSNLINLGQDIIIEKSAGSLYSYYFMTPDGEINTYNIYRGDTDNNPNSGLKTVILRAFATLTFNK